MSPLGSAIAVPIQSDQEGEYVEGTQSGKAQVLDTLIVRKINTVKVRDHIFYSL